MHSFAYDLRLHFSGTRAQRTPRSIHMNGRGDAGTQNIVVDQWLRIALTLALCVCCQEEVAERSYQQLRQSAAAQSAAVAAIIISSIQ